ncbi:MAG: hypothetical protein SFY81_08875 [Verrucomicrobiota bacterium]|nr:hypothetical protein [Verrucomicrobiota bacterium]
MIQEPTNLFIRDTADSSTLKKSETLVESQQGSVILYFIAMLPGSLEEVGPRGAVKPEKLPKRKIK